MVSIFVHISKVAVSNYVVENWIYLFLLIKAEFLTPGENIDHFAVFKVHMEELVHLEKHLR